MVNQHYINFIISQSRYSVILAFHDTNITISVCGSWNLTDSVASLLVGGEADLESGAQWPSLAVLFNVKRKASCTVTIFSPRWMVTSLTCVRENSLNPLEWVVFAGPSGYNPSASESAQIKLVKTILGHPGSRRGQHLVTSDLALVEIHDGLSFNSLVSPLCLADTPVQERQLCVTAGWTSSSEGEHNIIFPHINTCLVFQG